MPPGFFARWFAPPPPCRSNRWQKEARAFVAANAAECRKTAEAKRCSAAAMRRYFFCAASMPRSTMLFFRHRCHATALPGEKLPTATVDAARLSAFLMLTTCRGALSLHFVRADADDSYHHAPDAFSMLLSSSSSRHQLPSRRDTFDDVSSPIHY